MTSKSPGTPRLSALLTSFVLLVPASSRSQEVPVRVADNPPLWGRDVALVEEVRIGTLDGSPEYAHGDIRGIAVADDGVLWVGDRQLGVVRRYDHNGVFMDQIGRSGEGPGEFKAIRALRSQADNSVVVWDDAQLRITVFEPDGTVRRTFGAGTGVVGSNVVEELEVDRSGAIYVLSFEVPENFVSLMRGGEVVPWEHYWSKYDQGGALMGRVAVPTIDREGRQHPVLTFTALNPLGGLIQARNDDLAVTFIADGTPTRRVELPWTPVRYQRGERDEVQRLERLYSERAGHAPRRIPRAKPAFSALQVDADGRLWFRVHAEGERGSVDEAARGRAREACLFFGRTEAECEEGLTDWREPLVYEVVSHDGQYMGRVRLRTREVDLLYAKGESIWAVERGAFDEQYVVRYRVVAGGRP